jgi:hypothetical protein
MAKYSHAKIFRLRVQKQLYLVRRLNLKTVNEDYLKRQLRALLKTGYVSRLLNISHPKIYRVRINEGHKLFGNAKQLWWPPPECIKEKGRLNDIGQSIFYCSDSESTAVLEKRPKQGDIITILESELIDPNKQPLVTEVGIHEYTGSFNPKYGGTPPAQDLELKEFTQREGISNTNPILRDYLNHEITKIVDKGNEHEYKTTIAIADILMNEPELIKNGRVVSGVIDGLSYPSIAAQYMGANIGLRCEAADQLYKPVSCKVCIIEQVKDIAHYDMGEIQTSKSIETDGTINW